MIDCSLAWLEMIHRARTRMDARKAATDVQVAMAGADAPHSGGKAGKSLVKALMKQEQMNR